VEGDDLNLVAAGAALAVGIVDCHHGAVFDPGSVLRVGARQRQRDPDLDRLLLCARARGAEHARKSEDGSGAERTAWVSPQLHGFASLMGSASARASRQTP